MPSVTGRVTRQKTGETMEMIMNVRFNALSNGQGHATPQKKRCCMLFMQVSMPSVTGRVTRRLDVRTSSAPIMVSFNALSNGQGHATAEKDTPSPRKTPGFNALSNGQGHATARSLRRGWMQVHVSMPSVTGRVTRLKGRYSGQLPRNGVSMPSVTGRVTRQRRP